MFQHVLIGQYIAGHSILHRLDPRSKLLGVMVLVIIIFFATNWFATGFVLFFTLMLIFLSRISASFFLKAIKPILIFVIFAFILQLFTYREGSIIYEGMYLTITEEGLREGFFIVVRLLAIVILTSLVTLTTRPIILTDGLEALLQPFKKLKLPSHEIALMISIALRFIPTLFEETERLMKAQMSRGVSYTSGPWKKRILALISLLVPLFVHSFKRAEDLALAMDARAYRGGVGRSKFRELSWKSIDTIAIGIVLLTGIIIILLRFA